MGPVVQIIGVDLASKTAEEWRQGLTDMMNEFVTKGGGRSFGFTGAHFHRNWADEDFRRVVVNAILWSAKLDVPEKGAKVAFDAADLNKNLDWKGKGKPTAEPVPE